MVKAGAVVENFCVTVVETIVVVFPSITNGDVLTVSFIMVDTSFVEIKSVVVSAVVEAVMASAFDVVLALVSAVDNVVGLSGTVVGTTSAEVDLNLSSVVVRPLSFRATVVDDTTSGTLVDATLVVDATVVENITSVDATFVVDSVDATFVVDSVLETVLLTIPVELCNVVVVRTR